MTKQDIGTYVALAIGGLGPVLVRCRALMAKGLDALRVSFVAMVSSKAVWLASVAIGAAAYVGGFWLGHRAGGADVPDLAAQVSALKADAARLGRERAEAVAEADRARTEALYLARKLEDRRGAVAAPGAPVPRRPLAKVVKAAPPAAAPAPQPFRPFD